MKSSTRLALLLGLQLAAGAAFVACGGDDSDAKSDDSDGTGKPAAGDTPTANEGSGTLQLTFSPMYSAFVAGHEAQLPVLLKDTSLRGKGAKFTSSDPTIAVVSDTAEGGLITVKKDGVVTIKASFEGETGSAKLTIKPYTEAQWTTGRDRYSKTELAIIPPAGSSSVSLLAIGQGGMRNANGACNTCHTAQARTLKIENTPQQIAGYSDDELITIFTKGMKPANVTQQSMIPAFAWGMFHIWTVTEEEKQGLIAFLRTQTPKANPAMIDYGVKNCDGTPLMAPGAGGAGGFPMLCDSDGKPLSFPGLPGRGGDAGTSTTAPVTGVDAGGSSTATGDAGVAAARDAG